MDIDLKIKPTVSVIIPVYNSEVYVERCVDSVIAQTYKDYEIILVDDGSSDRSCAICDEYANRYPFITTIHKKNGGVSSARNFGIDKARGAWVCFIDSDDYIESNYLSNFGLSNKKADMYCQGYKIKQGDNLETVVLNEYEGIDNNKLVFLLETNNILNSPCFKLYNLTIVRNNNIKFSEKMSYGEDHLFTLQYLQHANTVVYQEGCFYVYVQNTTESLTRGVIHPRKLTHYIDIITPMLRSVAKRFSFSEHNTKVIINQRVHFHSLLAIKNFCKTGKNEEDLFIIKRTLVRNLDGFDGLTHNQVFFVLIVRFLCVSSLSILLRINDRMNITKRIKTSF